MELDRWITEVGDERWTWFVKRLSGNDTGATGGHQVGLYVPKLVVKVLFPEVAESKAQNPKAKFTVLWDSAQLPEGSVTLTWYNNRLFGGTRNEFRFTGWGGREAPLQDPENTGAVAVLAFKHRDGREGIEFCRVWLCNSVPEEKAIEAVAGPIEPGEGRLIAPSGGFIVPGSQARSRCWLDAAEIEKKWSKSFPKGDELVKLAVARCDPAGTSDQLLMRRRECEFEMFRSVEEHDVLPRLKRGFGDVDTFLEYSRSILNRRMSRGGRSLELHIETILVAEDIPHEHGAVLEGNKRPDFIFPSSDNYRNRSFARNKLRMLAAKTTCRDRWRQVLEEAPEISTKHLLTLQEGVSESQFNDMKKAGVQLVVPAPLMKSYPTSVRPQLLTFGDFIELVRPK